MKKTGDLGRIGAELDSIQRTLTATNHELRRIADALQPKEEVPGDPFTRCSYSGVEGDRCDGHDGHTGAHYWFLP